MQAELRPKLEEVSPASKGEIILPNSKDLLVQRKRILSGKKKRMLALLACSGILAMFFFIRSRLEKPAIHFETAVVGQGSIQAFITATGTLNPVVNVQVGSQVSGNIKALYADFNTKVKKGQVIAEIDPQIFQAQVAAAQASVNQQLAAIASSDALVAKADAEVASAEATRNASLANSEKDRANMLNAEKQWNRVRGLFAQGVVSEQDRDSAKAEFDSSAAQFVSSQSQVDSGDRLIDSAKAQAVAARAQRFTAIGQWKQAEATLAQAKINLDHTRIVAPVSGTVIARHFDVGQTVAASFQAPDIFDIGEDLSKMQVDTNVDESDVGSVVKGQRARFTVDAYLGREFVGTVADIRKAPINAQNVITYDVVITAENDDLKLFPGMTAKVTVFTDHLEKTLQVPNAALRYRPSSDILLRNPKAGELTADAQRVYILAGSDVIAVPVSVGITDGKVTAISSSDLRPGQTVILRSGTAAEQGRKN